MPGTGTIRVIDASALAAIVYDEPAGDQVAEQIRDCGLVAPSLLGYQMANVCRIKLRRHPLEREALLAALRMPGIAPEILDVDHDAVVKLAAQTGLTTYDASYLCSHMASVPNW